MTSFGYDIATTRVLWGRDLTRFRRQPMRIVAALGQPVIGASSGGLISLQAGYWYGAEGGYAVYLPHVSR